MPPSSRFELICEPLFLALAAALNLPPFILGIIALASWCTYFSPWLLGNAGLSLVNMAAALYSVYQIRKLGRTMHSDSDDGEANDIEKDRNTMEHTWHSQGDFNGSSSDEGEERGVQNNEENNNNNNKRVGFVRRLWYTIKARTHSTERLRHLLFYDGLFATYCILFLFWIVWLSEGTQRVNGYDRTKQDYRGGCSLFHEHYVEIALVCGFSYVATLVLSTFTTLLF